MTTVPAIDDDDILMDYDDDDAPPAAAPAPSAPAPAPASATAGDSMAVDAAGAATSEDDVMVPEKVYLYGVDNLSTKLVLAYASEHFPSTVPERVEWIDDSSIKLVYPTPAVASSALTALTRDTETEYAPLTLRPTKQFSQAPDTLLQARIARPVDQKQKGARDRSRYYLFHPEEEPTYTRRQYSAREEGKRRREDRENNYNEDMYDDNAGARERRRSRSPPRRRGRGSRDRSRSPGWGRSRSPARRRDRTRSPRAVNRGRELFPDTGKGRDAPNRETRGKELFPEKTGDRELFSADSGKELFPEKTGRAAMDGFIAAPPPVRQVELFPQRGQGLFPGDGGAGRRELFPQQVQEKPKSLAERIQMPVKSLADRIQLPENGEGEGGRKTGSMGDGDFAKLMAGGKGEALVGGGRRRGRGGRSRAEDLFG